MNTGVSRFLALYTLETQNYTHFIMNISVAALETSPTVFGWDLWAFREDEHVIMSSYLLILTAVLATSLAMQYLVQSRWKITTLSTAAVNVLIGMFIGAIIKVSGGYEKRTTHHFDADLLGLSTSVFFFGFLPLIIFESGYHLKRRLFSINMSPICLLAFLGTCISTAVIALGLHYLSQIELLHLDGSFSFIELVCFASLVSSTDPVSTLVIFSNMKVEPDLFYMVFGESVLNDAVAITVFTITARLVGQPTSDSILLDCLVKFLVSFIASCIIGYSIGILAALLFKLVDVKNNKTLVVSTFLCLVYLPFFLSECLQLSGIVTVLLTGVAARRYVNKNIAVCNKIATSFVIKTASTLAESACFCLLGLSVFSQSSASVKWMLITVTIALMTIGRALHVYPLLSMVNICRRGFSRSTSAPNTTNINSSSRPRRGAWLACPTDADNNQVDSSDHRENETCNPISSASPSRHPRQTEAAVRPSEDRRSGISRRHPSTGNPMSLYQFDAHVGTVTAIPIQAVEGGGGEAEAEVECHLEFEAVDEIQAHISSVIPSNPERPRIRDNVALTVQCGETLANYINLSNGVSPTAAGLVSTDINTPAGAQTDVGFNNQISTATKHMVFFAGLRGAVAYSCAQIFPDNNGHREIVVTTTVAIILITILIQGFFTQSVVKLLGIRINVDTRKYVQELQAANPVRVNAFERRFVYPWVLATHRRQALRSHSLHSHQPSHHQHHHHHNHPPGSIDRVFGMEDSVRGMEAQRDANASLHLHRHHQSTLLVDTAGDTFPDEASEDGAECDNDSDDDFDEEARIAGESDGDRCLDGGNFSVSSGGGSYRSVDMRGVWSPHHIADV